MFVKILHKRDLGMERLQQIDGLETVGGKTSNIEGMKSYLFSNQTKSGRGSRSTKVSASGLSGSSGSQYCIVVQRGSQYDPLRRHL